jgi:hypothetical protein
LKKCVACAKDLPDTAPFCAFCGAKQPAAPQPQAGANAKTVLGYSAADLLKNMPGGAPRPGAPAPAPAPQPFQPPPAAPQQFAPPPQQFAPPPAAPAPQPFQPPPQQFAPPPAAPQGFGGPPAGFPPPAQGGQFGGSASTAATMFMANAPQIPAQPPQQPPFQPPPPMAAAPQPFQPPPPQPMGMGMPPQQPFQPPPPQPMGMPMGGPPMGMPQPAPMGMPGQPPFLASQTAARMDKPVEPFNDMTKLVLLIFGACLLAFAIVPLSLSPFAMMVTAIGDLPGSLKLLPILVILGGAGGIALSMMPLPALQRGLFAAALGIVPILLFTTVLMGGFSWQMLIFPLGGVLVPTGLLLRDAYPTEKLPRLFVFIGAACIIVPFFVPFRLIDMVLDLLKSIVHPQVAIAMLGGFMPVLLAAIAVILCLIPGRFKFGAKQIAWAFFLFPIAFNIAELTVDGSIVKVLTHGPGLLFAWSAMALPSKDVTANATFALPMFTAFAAFATWGLATLFGKQLEMSK